MTRAGARASAGPPDVGDARHGVTAYARVPLRVTLTGGGTDLASYYATFGGFVVSATIDKHVRVSLTRTAADADGGVRWADAPVPGRLDPSVRDAIVEACRRCLDDRAGLWLRSEADVAVGTGLGSSGAFTVAVLAALHTARGEAPEPLALAGHAYVAETRLAGRAGGVQDAYLPCLGGLVALQISVDGSVQVRRPALRDGVLDELDRSLLLYSTGISRSSEDVLLAQQRAARAGFAPTLDSMHRCKDIGLQLLDALEAGDVEAVGGLLHEHWMAKRSGVGGVTTPRIDRLYELARASGATGGKLVGAGGGGHLLLHCPPARQPGLRAALAAEGLGELPFRITAERARARREDAG